MIEPVAGVMLGVDDATELLRVIAAYEQVLAETNRQASPRLRAVRDHLSRAASRVPTSNTHADARKQALQPDSGVDHAHELLDTAQSAAILGITADAVRDLARRRRLPARKVGGRWLLAAGPVLERAERRRT